MPDFIGWATSPSGALIVGLVGGMVLGLFGSFFFWRFQAHIAPK